MSISVAQLTKRFGSVTALDEVSFSIPKGAFFAVVGPSGCGKSSLLRLVAGLDVPDVGSIALEGQGVAGPGLFLPPEERRVGVVFQSYALWPHLTVEENVAFPYQARGLSAQEAKTRAREHIESAALSDLSDRRPEALSGGQRQRVALARCLAGEATTILMDEPLANLDPHLRGEMEAELLGFHRRTGVTTLYITHDQREAMALADLMAVMDRGRFLQLGPPEEIFDRPLTAAVARFIGRGTVLRAPVRAGHARIGGAEFAVTAADPIDGPAELLIRPQQITLSDNGLPARVASVHYRGGVWEALAEVEGAAEPFAIDARTSIKPGELVHLQISGGWVIPG